MQLVVMVKRIIIPRVADPDFIIGSGSVFQDMFGSGSGYPNEVGFGSGSGFGLNTEDIKSL